MASLISNPIGKPPAALDPDVDALANFLSGQGMGPEDYQAPGVGDIPAAAPPQTRAQAATPYEQEMSARANIANTADRGRAAAAQQLSDYFTDLASQKRADELKNEVAKSAAVPNAQGANAMALEKMKEEALTNRIQQTMSAANQNTEGGGGNKLLELSGMNAEGIPTFTVNKTPQLIQAQQANAAHGLGQIAPTRQMVDTAEKQGLIGPMMGPIMGQATGGNFPGNILSYFTGTNDKRTFTALNGALNNLQTAIATTLGSGRAASSPGILARFKQLLNPNQDPAALRGGIDAAERWMTLYANAKSSAELDAADAAIGVTPGPYQSSGADQNSLGGDWEYSTISGRQ